MIFICIPAYNEAATIGVLLWKVRRVMSEFPRDYEILVLDDASTDSTQDVLAPYARVLPLTVLRSEQRRGYAASLERLLREAAARASHPRRDMVITLQGDFSESPEDIPALVKRMEGGADIVEAVHAGSDREPRILRLARRAMPLLLRRAALPEKIRDPFSGFRAYRVSLLKRALAERNGNPLLVREGKAANVELLVTLAAYTKRVDATEVEARDHRRQRETRYRPWNTLVQLWEVGRQVRRIPPAATSADAAG